MRRVLVIGTGGTVSCTESEDGLSPALGVGELLNAVTLPNGIEIGSEQLFNLDSTNMTPRHWEKLARRIIRCYDGFDGFVITHGTDTMAYAAASLHCLIRNPRKPIALTGSMLPMNAESSDAPRNLRDAVMFAADERAFGVKLIFSGFVYDGARVTKTDSGGLFPFRETETGTSESLADYSARERSPSGGARFCGQDCERFYERLSDGVFHVKLIPGQALSVPDGTRALILEGYGSGGVPDYLLGNVTALSDAGVYVIIATQCACGGTRLNEYEVGRNAQKNCRLLETGSMSVEYAVARARLALAYSDNFDDFKRLFYGG